MKLVNFNPDFISRMLPKLDWNVLKAAAETVSLNEMPSWSTNFLHATPGNLCRWAMGQVFLTALHKTMRAMKSF